MEIMHNDGMSLSIKVVRRLARAGHADVGQNRRLLAHVMVTLSQGA